MTVSDSWEEGSSPGCGAPIARVQLEPAGGAGPLVDRRRDRRFQVGPHPIVLVWTQHGWLRRGLGRIVDLSRGGALLEVDRLPPPGGTAWLHLRSTDAAQWQEVFVREVTNLTEQRHHLRVEFRSRCSKPTFESFRLGVPLLHPRLAIDTFA